MIQNLVVGGDVFSLATYQTLCEKYGRENVLLLNSRPILIDDLKIQGPSTLRGPANLSIFNHLYPELKSTPLGYDSFFFKESRLHPFKGRAKPSTLLWGEEFFSTPRIDYDPFVLFPYLNDENFFESLNLQLDTILSISKTDYFEITTASGKNIQTLNLYFSEGPYQFCKLFSPKEKLSNEFLQFCEQTNSPLSLKIKFVFRDKITEDLSTLFIPLSQTYEMGHFVGEFKNERSHQIGNFIHFIDVADSSEEEIGKRIRLLKRNLEKIIPNFKKNKFKEYISLSPKTPLTSIDDDKFEKISSELKNLFFIGENAIFSSPTNLENKFGYPLNQISHVSRALLSHQNIFLNN
jgi:hypothetical protein